MSWGASFGSPEEEPGENGQEGQRAARAAGRRKSQSGGTLSSGNEAGPGGGGREKELLPEIGEEISIMTSWHESCQLAPSRLIVSP